MKKTLALIDERISDACLHTLVSLGFSVIKLKKVEGLPSPIASHTDIVSFKMGDELFFSKKYIDSNFDILPEIIDKITPTSDIHGESYPYDAIFNGLIMGDRLFCKSDTFSKDIMQIAMAKGIKIINVKQGYPACTTLKISENAAITADHGMATALNAEGISVLMIENGGVLLPPYEYGFIGGAASVYEDTVYFLGDINTHPHANMIIDFINLNKKRVISLSEEPLRDLGGIIFLKRK